jgi:hypothetical protein
MRNPYALLMGRPKRTTLSRRQLEALQLRAAGATYQQIGEVLKTNKGNAYRLVRDALPKREPSDEELRLDLFRLDQALMGLTPAIKQGDPEAVSLLIRVIETRARLRSKYYERHAAQVTVNQYNQQTNTDAVLVVQGDKQSYIEGLRRVRGEVEQPALPPPRQELLPVDPDEQLAIPGSPGGRTPSDLFGNGSLEQVGLSDGEVSQPSEPTNIIDQ